MGVREIQEEPGRQQENRRKHVAGTVAHQSTLIAFLRQAGWYVFLFSLGRDRDRSRPVWTVHQKILSSHKFARQPIPEDCGTRAVPRANTNGKMVTVGL